MASLISCPHCGARPKEEFAIRGLVPDRPFVFDTPLDSGDWFDSVYMRENPRGRIREHWYHGAGCGRWLIVERDNLNHTVYAVSDVRSSSVAGAGR